MVPEEGFARISLGGFAIGLCGAAPGFRAPKVALFILFVGARSRFDPLPLRTTQRKKVWCRRRGSNPHGLAATGF